MSGNPGNPGNPAHSYDRGEQIRVTRDGQGHLRIRHGAKEIATIRRRIGGGATVTVHDRTWALESTDDGWHAAGDPEARLSHRALRGDVLTVGHERYSVSRRRVKGLLRFRKDKENGKPIVRGEILGPPPPGADPHATIALATTAIVLGVDLTTTPVADGINGDNRSAALQYGGPGL